MLAPVIVLTSETPPKATWVVILTVLPSLSRNIGLFIPEISKVKFPDDSTEFNIPSLSKSRSKLSIIPSLSESAGHILTGIIPEDRLKSVRQSIVPESL